MDRPAAWRDLLHPPHALSVGVVVLGILTPAFSWFVTNTVLPSVVADIGGLPFYAWVSTGYSVAAILGTAGASVTTRRWGFRATLVGAAGSFVAGALTCAAAPAMALLIAGRALQGLGGGMMIATVHGLLRQEFPERLWARVLASISVAWGVAALTGPSVGGVLAGQGAWRGAFAAMVPPAVLGALLTWWLLGGRATPAREASHRVPLGRLALTSAGVFCVASVGNVASTPARLGLVAAALTLIALMLRLDGRARVRLFPSRMLRLGHPLGRAFWVVFFLAMSTTPVTVFLPLFLQVLHGASPALAGYLTAAQSLAWTTAAIFSARLGPGGVRRAVVLGPVAIAIGFAVLVVTAATGPLLAVAGAVLLLGGGIGAAWAHVGAIALAAARRGEEDVTASMIPSTQAFAVALGAALSGVIANAAGLSGGATRPAAALAAGTLYGAFVLVPLGAAVVATRLGAAIPARVDAVAGR
jgi:MFS family permease